jgi:polyhydroxyalkanoate synthesis regulator phasin
MAKYAGMRNRFPAMPQMVLDSKAPRSFSYRLNMLLSLPMQVMNRYSLYRKDIHTSLYQISSAPVITSIGSPVFSGALRQGFERKRVARNFPAADGPIAASSRLAYAMKEDNAVTKVLNSFINDQSAMFRGLLPSAIQGRQRESQIRYAGKTRHQRFFASLAEKYIRLVQRTFVDQISRRQGIMRKQPERRHETLGFAVLPETAGIHAASGRSRKSLTEQARELIFRGTDKIGREIDELKRTVKKTEDQVREKIAHQVREMMHDQNRKVDVGSLTLQVYRNIERMIRTERERRGM